MTFNRLSHVIHIAVKSDMDGVHVEPLSSEELLHEEAEYHKFAGDDAIIPKEIAALDSSNSWPLSRVTKKFMSFVEQTSNINNNNIWGKSPSQDFTSDGVLHSFPQELSHRAGNFPDVKSLTLSTLTAHTMHPENNVAKQDFQQEKPPDININLSSEDDAQSTPGKNVYKGTHSASNDREIESENLKTSAEDVIELTAVEENAESLSVKERICNIDLSIEWIKCELTLMRAHSLSLKERFEQLFGEIMEFKLRMEMAKDDEEQFLEEEEMALETQF